MDKNCKLKITGNTFRRFNYYYWIRVLWNRWPFFFCFCVPSWGWYVHMNHIPASIRLLHTRILDVTNRDRYIFDTKKINEQRKQCKKTCGKQLMSKLKKTIGKLYSVKFYGLLLIVCKKNDEIEITRLSK